MSKLYGDTIESSKFIEGSRQAWFEHECANQAALHQKKTGERISPRDRLIRDKVRDLAEEIREEEIVQGGIGVLGSGLGLGALGQAQSQTTGGQLQYSTGISVSPDYRPVEEQTKGESMMGFKQYIHKHADMVWTVFAVAIADHLLLKGVLRKRIQTLLEGFMDKIDAENNKK